jgi:hypothetical protein
LCIGERNGAAILFALMFISFAYAFEKTAAVLRRKNSERDREAIAVLGARKINNLKLQVRGEEASYHHDGHKSNISIFLGIEN